MIPVTMLDVHILADTPIDLGANPGSSLRGALYAALRAMYDTGQAVLSRQAAEANPVGWLLALEDDDTSGGKDVPRPMALRPPLDGPASNLTFGLVFYGSGREQIPMVLTALPSMGAIGVGRGRHRFELAGVDVVDPITFDAFPLVDRQGKAVSQLPEAPSVEQYEQAACTFTGTRLEVDFLTPTRIVDRGKLCQQPHFRPWFQRLLERLRLISEVYMEEPVWVPFRDLLPVAERVRILEENTRWEEMWSWSRRTGQRTPTSGFKGKVVYGGPFDGLLPWLMLGQALQVGKNTVKGGGWFRLLPPGIIGM